MKSTKLLPFAVAAAIALAACGGQAAAPTAKPAAPAATQAPAAPAQPTQAPKPAVAAWPKTGADVDKLTLEPGKKTEIEFWHQYAGAVYSGIQQIVNDFNAKNPYGIVVKEVKAGNNYNEVYAKINNAIAAGSGMPDLSQAYQNQAALYRDQGKLIDLTPFIQSSKYGITADEMKDYIPFFLKSDENPQFPGEVLGWPTQRSLEVLYVNLDMLKELGYTAPPKTFKEFEEMACKATDKAKERYGYAWRNDASQFASLVFAFGGNVLKTDASGYDFNSQAGVDALAMLQRMGKAGCVVQIPSAERNGEQTRFANGNLLFTQASSTGLTFYADAVSKGKNMKWGIYQMPQANPDKPKNNLYGASWSAYNNSPERALAGWLFMKYFTEKDNSAKWAQLSNYMTPRISAAADVVKAVKASDRFKNFPEAADGYANLYEWSKNGAVESPVAGYDPVRTDINDTVVNVVFKATGEPQAALDAAVKRGNDVLKENAPKSKK